MTTILIVDDQAYLRELFQEEMQDEGYSVMSVSNACSAKGYIKESKTDFALLDFYLNGFEVWDLLCDIKKGADLTCPYSYGL